MRRELLAEITRLRRAAIDRRLVGGNDAPAGSKLDALVELRGEDLVRQAIERVPSDRLVLLGAENQPDRRILIGTHPMLAGVVQIEVHLACVGVGERADLQVDHDETSERTVKEQEVDPVPRVTDPQPTLATDEGKVATELQEKVLEAEHERLLDVGLSVPWWLLGPPRVHSLESLGSWASAWSRAP